MATVTRVAAQGDAHQEPRPPCFGDPSRVCPKDAEGIIQPQAECVVCNAVKGCLQTALRREGMVCGPPKQSHAISKASHFLKRWSQRKLARSEREDTPNPS